MPIIRVGFDRAAWRINNPTYGSDFTGSKTYSADSQYSADYSADKVFDDNESTRYNSSVTNLPHWIKVDLGIGVTKTTRKLRMKTYGTGTIASVKDFKLQGSNNDTDWTDIYTGVQQNNEDWQEYTFNNSTSYRYYRIYVTSNYRSDGVMSIFEIEMMEVA